MCERVGSMVGNMYLTQTLGDAGWGKWWNQSRFVAAGRDDGVEALPLWVLRADVRSPHWNVLGDYLLSMWTGKHPERDVWRGGGVGVSGAGGAEAAGVAKYGEGMGGANAGGGCGAAAFGIMEG